MNATKPTEAKRGWAAIAAPKATANKSAIVGTVRNSSAAPAPPAAISEDDALVLDQIGTLVAFILSSPLQILILSVIRLLLLVVGVRLQEFCNHCAESDPLPAVVLQPRGLLNRLNSCFLNSVLQSMLAVQPFTVLLRQVADVLPGVHDVDPIPVTTEFARFAAAFEQVQLQSSPVVSSTEVKDVVVETMPAVPPPSDLDSDAGDTASHVEPAAGSTLSRSQKRRRRKHGPVDATSQNSIRVTSSASPGAARPLTPAKVSVTMPTPTTAEVIARNLAASSSSTAASPSRSRVMGSARSGMEWKGEAFHPGGFQDVLSRFQKLAIGRQEGAFTHPPIVLLLHNVGYLMLSCCSVNRVWQMRTSFCSSLWILYTRRCFLCRNGP